MKYKSTREDKPIQNSDRYLDDYIGIKLLEENDKNNKSRKSTGKLSAGKLYWPLQWQILNRLTNELDLKGAPIDEYTIRKFQRGKHVEEWFLSQIPDVMSKQDFCEYRGVIGYMDALVNTEKWNEPIGVIPLEVKSVASSKYKWIVERGADESHILQNCLYALAGNREKFAISYVAADDYRVKVFTFNTIDFKDKVDTIINEYEQQGLVVPVFVPRDKWQANVKYNAFPDWAELSLDEISQKIEELKKLKYEKKQIKEPDTSNEKENSLPF